MATGMFDFGPQGNNTGSVGGGINFNPSAAPGSSGSYNSNIDPFGGGLPTGGPAGQASGTGNNIPSWSPNTGNPSFNSNPGGGVFSSPSGTQGSGTSSVLPIYQGASGVNPSTNLTGAFGNLGPYLLSMIQTGGYNPQVFNDLVAQLQPQIAQGEATIGANTGASGTRFGSGYDLALGDFLSQVNLNEQGLAANLYQNSVQNSLSALLGALGPQSQYTSNQGGFLSSILSSLTKVLGPGLISGTLNGIGGVGAASSAGATAGVDLSGIADLAGIAL